MYELTSCLAVALGHVQPGGRVIADAEARVGGVAGALQRDERQRRWLVAEASSPSSCRRRMPRRRSGLRSQSRCCRSELCAVTTTRSDEPTSVEPDTVRAGCCAVDVGADRTRGARLPLVGVRGDASGPGAGRGRQLLADARRAGDGRLRRVDRSRVRRDQLRHAEFADSMSRRRSSPSRRRGSCGRRRPRRACRSASSRR